MADLLLGVDIGTTHVKAVLLEAGRGVRHVARRDMTTHRVGASGAYYEPEELLGAAMAVVGECAAAGAPGAIGIASMAESGVGLDRRSRPLGEILAWFDSRPAAEAASVEAALGSEELFARTGLRAEAKYTLPKLLWLQGRRRATYAKMRRWAGVAELVGHALTGELGTNASLACRTLAYDVGRRGWDAELLAMASLDEGQMPPVQPLGRPLGGLLPGPAARLGIAAGTPVTIAGHDHLVGALAAGVARPGAGLDSMGSAEVALVVTEGPALTDRVRRLGFSTGLHAVDGTGYVLGGLQSSGSLVEWFIDTFVPGANGMAGDERYGTFLALLSEAAAGPGEILVAPYLRGRTAPFRETVAALQVAGLRSHHTLADLAAAILDGATFHVRWMFEELEQATGVRLSSIRITGGGARNERWLSAKSAASPYRLEAMRTDEAVSLGAALVAGMASGTYGSLADALRDAAPGDPVRRPPAARRRYEAAYRERWLPWIKPDATSE